MESSGQLPDGTMLSLVLTAGGLAVEARAVPEPGEGEVLLRVRLAGVCATDIELTRGYKGGFRGVLGHEFVGEVVTAPSAPAWVGRRVVGEINIGCGVCDLCRRGLGKHCRARSAVGISGHDGAFAGYLTLPVANLHAVPERVTDTQAVFVEPLAAAFQILAQVAVTPATRVYVLGDGRLGLLCALALATTGCDLTVIGRHPAKLAIAAHAGAATCLADEGGLAQLVQQPADVVVEATGVPGGFAQALQLTRPAGTLVLKSTYAGLLPALDASHLVVDEISVVGSRCGPFDRALAALEQGEVDVLPLVQARYPLAEGIAAFDHARQKGVLKVLIDPWA